jgi:ketosteroid isomerase-like protein
MWEKLDMRRQLKRLAVLAVMGAAAVACGNSVPREFGKEDVAALRTMTQQFQDAYNAKDSAKVAGYFSGAGALMPPNSSAVRGSDAIKGYYDIRFSEGATDLKLDPTTVNGSGSLAYLKGTYSFRNTPEGGPETRDRGKFLWIARLFPGNAWKFEEQMWSSDLPPHVAPAPETEKDGKK